MVITYRKLVGMVLRLIAAGMDRGRAIQLVSESYAYDQDSLREWVLNHTQ